MSNSSGKPPSEWKDLTIRDKIKYFINNITVEPVVLFYIIPNALEIITTSNLKLEKACRVNLNYSEQVCNKLMARDVVNLTTEDDKVQEAVSWMNGWVTALHSLLPLLLLFFIGSWSDRNRRRKPFLMMPLIGEFASVVGLVLCTYFMWWPMEVNGLIEGVFPSLTGGWMVLTVALYSYLADITTEEQRTIRFGFAHMAISLGLPFGTFFSGYLYQTTGYYGVFSSVGVLYLCGILYCAYLVKESQTPKPLPSNFIADFFDVKHIPETFKVVVEKRQGNRRIRIFLLILLSVVLTGPIVGEGAVGYYFTRKQLKWDEVDYAWYSTYNSILGLFGIMIVLGLFTSVLHLDDAVIGVIACIFKVLSNLIFAFSKDTLTFYLVCLVEMISGMGLVTMRSILTKLVPSDDMGKVNSVSGIVAALVQVTFPSLYSIVYASSIASMPGAFFILGAGLYTLGTLLFLCLYMLKKKDGEDVTHDSNEEVDKPTEVHELLTEEIKEDVKNRSKPMRLRFEDDNHYEDIQMIDE